MLSTRARLTADRLREVLHYDPGTGIFRWRLGNHRKPKGSIAGAVHSRGYILIGVDSRRYFAHRLAMLYMTGKWPLDKVDHRDRNPRNNSWTNIREATQRQNSFNLSKRSDNTSGIPGVVWRKDIRKWDARIWCGGKKLNLGVFSLLDDAVAARRRAELTYFGEFAPSREAPDAQH